MLEQSNILLPTEKETSTSPYFRNSVVGLTYNLGVVLKQIINLDLKLAELRTIKLH